MVKLALIDAFNNAWPMIVIFAVILSSFRIVYLIVNKEKFVLYKEFLLLLFLVYILLLFYIVSFQDNNYGYSNYIPFREIFRYDINNELFFTNVIGNILLFIPFGLFASHIIKAKRVFPIFFLALISSLSIEFVQIAIGRVFDVDDVILNVFGGVIGYYIYKLFCKISSKFPKFFKKNWFMNLILLLLFILGVLYFSDIIKYLTELVKK